MPLSSFKEISMATRRVLVLTSFNERLDHLRNNPSLTGYEFDSLGAVDLMHLDRHGLLLRGELERRILTFRPGFLVVHTGYAFLSYPKEMITQLCSLKSDFGKLRIGLQRGPRFVAAILRLQQVSDPELRNTFRREILGDDDGVRDRRISSLLMSAVGHFLRPDPEIESLIIQVLCSDNFDDSREMRELIKQIFY